MIDVFIKFTLQPLCPLFSSQSIDSRLEVNELYMDLSLDGTLKQDTGMTARTKQIATVT